MRSALRRTLSGAMLIPLLAASALGNVGCSSIIRGKHQEVEFDFHPAGSVAIYRGREIESGEKIMIVKGPDSPTIHFDGEPHAYQHNLKYEMDPWLIADCGLLLLGIIPGVIALVVDVGNGTWRYLRSPQTVYLPFAAEPQTAAD